jgi:hypothetical protein
MYAPCSTTAHVEHHYSPRPHTHGAPLESTYTCKSCKEFVEITGKEIKASNGNVDWNGMIFVVQGSWVDQCLFVKHSKGFKPRM